MRHVEKLQPAEGERDGDRETQSTLGQPDADLTPDEDARDRSDEQPPDRSHVDVARHEMAEAGDPEEGSGVEDVRADDEPRGQGEREQHRETEERAAPDRREPDDEAADRSDRDRDDPIPPGQPNEARSGASRPNDGLGEEAERADDQGHAEHLPLDRVDAVPVRAGQVGGDRHAEERHRCAPEQHPAAEPCANGPEAPVSHGAERFEDGAVQDCRCRSRPSA